MLQYIFVKKQEATKLILLADSKELAVEQLDSLVKSPLQWLLEDDDYSEEDLNTRI